MRAQRIILIEDSRLLGELLGTLIQRDKHLQMVRKLDGRGGPPSAITESETDWVVLTLPLGNEIPPWVDQLIEEHPALRFMAIFAGSGKIKIRWPASHEEEVEDISLADLLEILEREPQQMTGIR